MIRQVFDLDLINLDVLGDLKETEQIVARNNINCSTKIIKEMMPLVARRDWYWDN